MVRVTCESDTYPPPEDLIDRGALLQRAFGHHIGAHLFHIQHESVKGFLNVRSFGLLLFSLLVLRFPGETGGRKS